MTHYRVSYGVAGYEPTEVPEGRSLAIALDATISPLLFGCRTGICGTCLVEVLEGFDALPPPDDEERELLEVLSDHPRARLACQIDLRAPVTLCPLV